MTAREARLYRLLLRLFPAEFRARYGRAMLDFHRDRVTAARRGGQSLGLLWIATIADALRSAAGEWYRLFTHDEALMRVLWQDLGYAVRGLSRRPAFTAIVVATIALGIGANAAIFSVVNGVLLQPLPYPRAERVVSFTHEAPQWLSSEPDFIDYHRELKSFAGLAAYTHNDVTLTSEDDPERLRMVRATEDFFPVLGVPPMLGRTFTADEYSGNPPRVVVLSYGLWQRRFGADPAIVGKTVSLGGIPRAIVGVMPRHFDFPEPTTDLWSPQPRFTPDSVKDRGFHYLFMVGRLAPGASVVSAFSEANGIAKRIMRDYPGEFDPKRPLIPHIEAVGDRLLGSTRPYLVALLGAVGFVLLIACANVANLLLVRGESRQKEMAVRRALGASGFRLVSQLLIESTLLAAIGGALGLLVAWGGDRALIALAPSSIPRLDEISIDWHVVAFSGAAAVLTGFLIGITPALRAARGDSAGALKESGRVTSGASGSPRLRRTLVAAEVALAVVALSGAGMLLRSLQHLERADLGFDPHDRLTAVISLAPRAYDDARAATFFQELVHRLGAVPNVRAVGAAGWLPVVDAGGLRGFMVEGQSYQAGQVPLAVPQQATPGYFSAIGLPIVRGREFSDDDRDGALPVAIVSERFAQQAWPSADAIGKRFQLGGGPLLTVVGVVRDIRARGFGDTPEPTMYFPYAQATRNAFYQPRTMTVILRTTGDPTVAAPALRKVVHGLDPMAPVSSIRTLDDVAATSISNRRFNTTLLVLFAALALVLAGIGTYGVISYGVSQRAFEIGVRVALGANDRSVLWLVMAEGVGMCGIGLCVGLAASVGLERALRSLLVDLPAIDVVSLAATSVVLAAVTVAATIVPGRRALQLNPLDTLRGS